MSGRNALVYIYIYIYMFVPVFSRLHRNFAPQMQRPQAPQRVGRLMRLPCFSRKDGELPYGLGKLHHTAPSSELPSVGADVCRRWTAIGMSGIAGFSGLTFGQWHVMGVEAWQEPLLGVEAWRVVTFGRSIVRPVLAKTGNAVHGGDSNLCQR